MNRNTTHGAAKAALITLLVGAAKLGAAEATAPVNTDSEAYKKAYEKAYAEEKAKAAAATSDKPATEIAPATAASGKIEDVTVLAKKETPAEKPYVAETQTFKRPAPLKDTPQQITVVSQQVLQDQRAVDLKDALRNTPGITVNSGEAGQNGGDNFNMRGYSAVTDIFIDGVRDSAQYSRDLFGIEQVEIAKGTSGVYSGRGSTGGSVNLVTKTARADTFGSLDFSATSYDSIRTVADLNVDVSKQVEATKDYGVAFRMVAMVQDGGSPRSVDIKDDRFGLLPSVTFGLGKQTRITLSHEYYQQYAASDYGVPYAPVAAGSTTFAVPSSVDYSNWYGIKGVARDNVTSNITTARIVSEIDDNNTLQNITRFNSNQRDTIQFGPNGRPIATTGTVAGPYIYYNGVNAAAGTITMSNPLPRYTDDRVISNQTDWISKFKTGEVAHTFNLGAEIQEETLVNRARLIPNPWTTNLANPNNDAPATASTTTIGTGSFPFSGAKQSFVIDTYSLYLNDTISPAKWVDLIGGVRYDRFEGVYRSWAANYTQTNTTGAVTTVANPAVTKYEVENNLVGWRGGVVLKPTEQVSVYGTVANSFNPAFGNRGTVSGQTVTNSADLKPEETYLYEAGVKWEPVKERLLLGAAYFYVDKVSQFMTDSGGLLSTNGASHSQGLELAVTGAITKKWNVIAGFTYMDSEVTKTSSSAVASVGKELTLTPNNSATLWTTYDFGLGWSFGGGVRYVGKSWLDAANTITLPDYVVGDVALYYQMNKWCRFQVNVNNIADTHYLVSARVAADNSWALPGAGRTIAGSIRLSF